ncbi:GNAT family N-acetyltransferase [Streptomyces alkaliphilus]|uniref:GNAT family N-acetyltransferase n=1 Tax=Streptomyces alkaliphilus TaxID=1472722 RepID=UPI0034D182DD
MIVYESESLGNHHRLDSFDCGKDELNSWLVDSALHCNRSNTARTFVWVESGGSKAVAYYSLTAHLVEKGTMPSRLGRGSPEQCPAVLLARLALDKKLQGRGLGGVLLADALEQVVLAVRNVAARFLVVDALDGEAVAFYERYGFKRIPGDNRLFRKMSDITASLTT